MSKVKLALDCEYAQMIKSSVKKIPLETYLFYNFQDSIILD